MVKSSSFGKIKRRSVVLFWLVFRFNRYKQAIKRLLASVIDDLYKHKSKVPRKTLLSIVESTLSISLPLFKTRDGNTSYFEQISLASLIKYLSPKNILEIGTFNGFSSLNFALNSHDDTKITTVDLPKDTQDLDHLLDVDVPFIQDKQKQEKLYLNTKVSYKVRQIFADSTKTEFCAFQTEDKPFDFIFIDAGHSYMCVKNDTEKALKVLSNNGAILWHDYTPNCQGVFKYLNKLKEELPLVHIENTTLVYYKKN